LFIGFSPNGNVLLEDEDEQLHLYRLRGDEYKEVWGKAHPPVMSKSCKAMRGNGEILMQAGFSTPTLLFTHDLYKIKSYQREGRLLGCTDDGLDLYGRGTLSEDAGDWQIDVWDEEKRVLTLSHPSAPGQPEPERDGWGPALSACTAGDKIVVVELYTMALDVFTKQGILLKNSIAVRVSHHANEYNML
jgi:hypothetical protein